MSPSILGFEATRGNSTWSNFRELFINTKTKENIQKGMLCFSACTDSLVPSNILKKSFHCTKMSGQVMSIEKSVFPILKLEISEIYHQILILMILYFIKGHFPLRSTSQRKKHLIQSVRLKRIDNDSWDKCCKILNCRCIFISFTITFPNHIFPIYSVFLVHRFAESEVSHNAKIAL